MAAVVHLLRDGLQNIISRLGTRTDKSAWSTYTVPVLSPEEIDAAFRTTWFRKICEIPAFDACRWAMDTLKRTAPIWKKEHFAEGDAAWVEGTPLG